MSLAGLLSPAALSAWRGLGTLHLADLGPVEEGRGHGRLGSGHADFVLARGAGYEEPLRVWLDDDDRVLAIDVEYPGVPGLAEALGEPAARRDFHWAGLELEGGELVWPDRGLALFVNPETGEALRLEVFPAGTLADYDARARLALVPRRRW